MPLYEDRSNVENHIKVSCKTISEVTSGTENVIKQIVERICIKSKKVSIAFEGWYGIDWPRITLAVSEGCKAKGVKVEFVNANTMLKSNDEISEYKQTFLTDDPFFGWANLNGAIEDIMDFDKTAVMKNKIKNKDFDGDILIVYSCGAAIEELYDKYDMIFYFDKTMQAVLWMMWDGVLTPFGYNELKKDYFWKEWYYCDYYLLLRQRQFIINRMEYYVQAIEFDDLKLLTSEAYNELIQTAVKYPIIQVDYYQPGAWGGYRFKDIANVKGLGCNAWHLTVGPDLSILIDFGGEDILNLPYAALMQYQKEICGEVIAKEYPSLFPVHACLDDGYFTEPKPYERTSMPQHNHPDTEYVKRHFNEMLGRYETYYIIEAYEGAGTWMGYKDDCDLEEWERKCRETNGEVRIENWQDYVNRWDTKVGDLFLIPPGTVHGHGGNQMVLEMDTCPSIPANEYSFLLHGYASPMWNHIENNMTGKPMRMQLEHGFDNEKWRRKSWVEENLRAKPKVIKWDRECTLERYSSLPEMPFEIERVHYYGKGKYDTEGKFMHIATLAVGSTATIRSKSNPEYHIHLNRYQTAIVPACFGEYEIQSDQGTFNTIIIYRWKKG